MKKCLIVSNGYFDNASTISQRNRLKERLADYGYVADELKSNAVLALIDGENVSLNIGSYDFCIYLDKDVSLALMLEKAGLRLYNSANAIRLCDDKFLTYIALANNGLKMPKTISSPLMYSNNKDSNFLDTVEKQLNYPIVVKKVYGSMGKGVFLAENRKDLDGFFEKFCREPHLYQEFISENSGEDIRVITIGGKAVAAMKRKNLNDFRSNVELGGVGEKTELNDELIRIAEKASKVLGLDYAGIDIIGGNLICEVNSNAFFKEFERVTDIDVAKTYVEYIIRQNNLSVKI